MFQLHPKDLDVILENIHPHLRVLRYNNRYAWADGLYFRGRFLMSLTSGWIYPEYHKQYHSDGRLLPSLEEVGKLLYKSGLIKYRNIKDLMYGKLKR